MLNYETICFSVLLCWFYEQKFFSAPQPPGNIGTKKHIKLFNPLRLFVQNATDERPWIWWSALWNGLVLNNQLHFFYWNGAASSWRWYGFRGGLRRHQLFGWLFESHSLFAKKYPHDTWSISLMNLHFNCYILLNFSIICFPGRTHGNIFYPCQGESPAPE